MYKAWIIFILGLVFMVSGCASTSHRDETLARLLGDMEKAGIPRGVSVEKPVDSYRLGSDSPDRPVAGLPSLPDMASTAHDKVSSRVEAPDLRDTPSDTLLRNERGAGRAEGRLVVRSAPDITIQPDCVVQIGVAEDPTLDDNYPVNEIGAVDLKYIGPVILVNKTEEEAALKISEVLVSREFRKATVKVKILRASYDKIKVDGAVEKVGLIRIGAGDKISMNDALLRAGGIRASAKGAKIRVVRGGLLSAVGDALNGEEYALVDENGVPRVPDVMLKNNDVVIVFSSEAKLMLAGGEKEILVVGEVNRPGVYRFTNDEPCTIMHLVFKMGGLPAYANKRAMIIMRKNESGEEEEIEVDAEKILKEGRAEDDYTLENGDRVVVPARRISLF